jgi:folate-binding protein YgfZ
VLWDIFIWRMKAEKWACYIEVDSDEVDNVMRHLKRHKLRSKIELRAVDDHELALWAAWGVEEAELPNYHLVDPRAEGFGYRMLLQGKPQVGDVPMLDAEQYRVRRYMFGIPEGQREIAKEAALPMECNIDLSSGIDFRKGCYVGQELTIRTKHTGVVRKRILPVQLYRAGESIADADGQPAYNPDWRGEAAQGADIKQLDAEGSIKKGRSAGKFIAGVGNVGLALCRLEMMTPMRVSAEGGTYDPEVEFALQSSGTETEVPVRVKAFIPPWLLSREKELWSKGRKGSVE